MNYNILICNICNLELDSKKDIIIYYHDKDYHKRCIMEEYEDQGWYTCTYCCHEDKNDFYLDKLICKKDCITVQNTKCKINKFHDVIYNNKIYHDYCFQKYIDSLLEFIDINVNDNLNDNIWIDKKERVMEKNISSIKIKDGTLNPEELEK